MVNKRKRVNSSDSESDEITPGKQVLPVANLPHDFDKEPQDGMQYLFLVRRDARRLPRVTRVQNPYEVFQTNVVPTPTPSSSLVLPREEWKIAFQMHFSNMRKNLTQATIYVGLDHRASGKMVVPERKDRDGWWKFLAGYPQSEWSPRDGSARRKSSKSHHTGVFAEPVHLPDATNLFNVQSGNEPCNSRIAGLDTLPRNAPEQPDIIQTAESMNLAPFGDDPWISSEGVGEGPMKQLLPPEVTPSHLQEIDHRTSIHLLMYFTHWINVHLQNPTDPKTVISLVHGRWIFALLTKVEDQLSGDEMNLLRNLARACLGLIQKYKGALLGATSTEDMMMNMTEASCWMIFAAIAGHWGQRDLWVDAEMTLAM